MADPVPGAYAVSTFISSRRRQSRLVAQVLAHETETSAQGDSPAVLKPLTAQVVREFESHPRRLYPRENPLAKRVSRVLRVKAAAALRGPENPLRAWVEARRRPAPGLLSGYRHPQLGQLLQHVRPVPRHQLVQLAAGASASGRSATSSCSIPALLRPGVGRGRKIGVAVGWLELGVESGLWRSERLPRAALPRRRKCSGLAGSCGPWDDRRAPRAANRNHRRLYRV